MKHFFTPEQAEFIREHAKGRGNAELMDMFNAHFGMNLVLKQIKAYKKNHKVSSDLDGRFEPGHIPFNKGRKGVNYEGMKPTQFKAGHRPANWVPIGSERITKDGYIQIKIQEGKFQKNWRGKHILIWEEDNGPLPPGHAVIFGDGDVRNFDPDNLILVSRAQLVRMNQRGLIQDNAELTRMGVIIADIHNKIGERKKRAKKREKARVQ